MARKRSSKTAAPVAFEPGGILLLHDSSSNVVIDRKRLQLLEMALRFGDEIDEQARADLLQLIEYTKTTDELLHRKPKRGRKINPTLHLAAAIVQELHKRHGWKLEAALSAVVREDYGTEDERRRLRQNVERTTRELAPLSDEDSYALQRYVRLLLDPATKSNSKQRK